MNLRLAGRYRAVDKFSDVSGSKLITLTSGVCAGKLQHLLDHVSQTPSFAIDHVTVLRNLFGIVDDSVSKILARRTDHREGRAQFVRYAGNEINLLTGQTLCASH